MILWRRGTAGSAAQQHIQVFRRAPTMGSFWQADGAAVMDFRIEFGHWGTWPMSVGATRRVVPTDTFPIQ